jgi:hypothetical protein
VRADHQTTIEITSEDFLTETGTCIVGINSDTTLRAMSNEIKNLARRIDTVIVLKLSVNEHHEEIRGCGDSGLTYADGVSMVARKSDYVCDRTLMVKADKSASELDRQFIDQLKDDKAIIECELILFTE